MQQYHKCCLITHIPTWCLVLSWDPLCISWVETGCDSFLHQPRIPQVPRASEELKQAAIHFCINCESHRVSRASIGSLVYLIATLCVAQCAPCAQLGGRYQCKLAQLNTSEHYSSTQLYHWMCSQSGNSQCRPLFQLCALFGHTLMWYQGLPQLLQETLPMYTLEL